MPWQVHPIPHASKHASWPSMQALAQRVVSLEARVAEARQQALANPLGSAYFAIFK